MAISTGNALPSGMVLAKGQAWKMGQPSKVEELAQPAEGGMWSGLQDYSILQPPKKGTSVTTGPWPTWAKANGWSDSDLYKARNCMVQLGEGDWPDALPSKNAVHPKVLAHYLVKGGTLSIPGAGSATFPGGCAINPMLTSGKAAGYIPKFLPKFLSMNLGVPANGQEGTAVEPQAAPDTDPAGGSEVAQAAVSEPRRKLSPLLIGAGATLAAVLLFRGLLK